MKKRFFILLGLLIAVGAAYYLFSSNSKQETTYLTESVTRGNVEKTVIASDRKSTRLNSSHSRASRMPSSA